LVTRGVTINIIGQRLITDGQPCLVDVEEKLEGKLAILAQQEINHQNGIFLPDSGLEVETF
jgi:peptide deformylase